SLGNQIKNELATFRLLQIHRNGHASAQAKVEVARTGNASIARGKALDADHLGAKIRQHHGGERRWANALHLHDANACKRTASLRAQSSALPSNHARSSASR